ncbi:uncharacterized protein, partial [Thunnus thynnus]|uniref:uncharacterized protein n=1 Tax=Thunnus thynnus TaxID=8237 RepID=UPI003527F50E
IAGDTISPVKDEVSEREGESVTLTCTYQTSSDYPVLYWYRHDSDLQAPQFILLKGAKSASGVDYIPNKRYTSQTSATTTELTIQSLTLADTALYYCALQPTDGNNSPKFILSRFKLDEGNTPDEFKERFSSTLDSNLRSVPLKIQKLQLSDSAVYYCAVQPTIILCYSPHYTSCLLDNHGVQSLQLCCPSPLDLCVSCEELTPVNNEENSLEGSTVTLSYTYSKEADSYDYFFWYRQYPGKPPEFLISHYGTGNPLSAAVPRLSFKVSEDKTQMDLQISSAAVSDSAVYYCALQPTVT